MPMPLPESEALYELREEPTAFATPLAVPFGLSIDVLVHGRD